MARPPDDLPTPQQLAATGRVRVGVAALASRLGRSQGEVEREAQACLRELRTGHAPLVMRLFVRAGRALVSLGYDHIDYDAAQVARLRQLLGRHPAAILSSHRSYLDGGALTVAFADQGLPRPIEFVGINLAFWPFGSIWRRSGGIFIRRGDAGPVYKFALREWLGTLVEHRRQLRWFIEGSRSRTGKLGPSKLGLLVYLVDAYREGRSDDLLLIPVSVSYDQLQEVAEFAGEARGAAKQAESLGWLFRYIRAQRGRYGTIYVRFGEPVSLREELGPSPLPAADREAAARELNKLAFEVSWRINQATPITGASLLTLTLLGARGRALTLPQIRTALSGYLAHARRLSLPLAPTARLDDDAAVARMLAALEAYGVVERYAEGRVPVHRIAAEGHLAAAYYRNSIIHFFLTAAIAELALLAAADAPPGQRLESFWQHAYELRDLLKFEFFFREKQDFRQAVEAELQGLAPGWRRQLDEGQAGIASLLATVPLLSADMALRSFVEAYWVVTDVLVRWPGGEPVDERQLLQRCLAAGRQYLLQQRLRSPESVSRHVYVTGTQLARHRGLLGDGEDTAAGRALLAAELEGWLGRMGVVRRIAVQRLEQMLAAEAP